MAICPSRSVSNLPDELLMERRVPAATPCGHAGGPGRCVTVITVVQSESELLEPSLVRCPTTGETAMQIRYGFNIEITVPQRTTVITKMDVANERLDDLVWEKPLSLSPAAPMELWTDCFDNRCRRIEAEAGKLSL